MTDLDSTQILNADESLVQNTSLVETVNHLKISLQFDEYPLIDYFRKLRLQFSVDLNQKLFI